MIEASDVRPLIRELRNRFGLTPQDLAIKFGVSVQAISRWEKIGALGRPSSLVQRQMEQTLHKLGAPGEDLLARYFRDEAEAGS